ncbi:cytochrome d ubiquinol oxidase subunit II [Arthrobacter pigmenti]|uniref:Cytochrome d ubiquinol oxidase subunit II n=1 Tax=Arthrobacter pigmenti TaxID=271432 RepID=A0A846RG08_9MICC|nr:cytochrome d ubiquinol oxidase subunit II [Arthrobacter pigmenti]NJC22128.1 cytochrome d ubiquinol oxidase subunit II [Arthrobacter pigmenti]
MNELLPTIWFILIAVLWTGYLFLEGFDLGVGMLMKVFARTDRERRVLLNTIGPVWDGNEVWLLTAVGATFAAFPFWYASLLSSLYLPLVLVLLALIFRAVGFEYRGKMNSDRWRRRWDRAIFAGSLTSAAGIGATLAVTTTGLPLNANGDRVGGPFAWLSFDALLGAAAVVLFCLVHALAFLVLKTAGSIRERARRVLIRLLPVAVVPLLLWGGRVHVAGGTFWTGVLLTLAVVAVTCAWLSQRKSRDGWGFVWLGVFLAASLACIFGSAYPVVLPSTLDEAFSLTVQNASSSPYTLGLMSIIAAFGVPLVLAYQGWTYWVFRKRVSEQSIPEAHTVTPL